MPAFISYSQKDEAVYSALCMAFDAGGVTHWDSAAMSPGSSLASQLREAIQSCEICIFIATKRSIESKWCLAELGAFWGSGKTVIMFLADPDLTDAVLPPQFKGSLLVGNALKLLEATKKAIAAYDPADHSAIALTRVADYGTDKYIQFIKSSRKLDLSGIALQSFHQRTGYRDATINRAEAGCEVRVLLMDESNDALKEMLNDKSPLDQVRRAIAESVRQWRELSSQYSNVQVTTVRRGIVFQ